MPTHLILGEELFTRDTGNFGEAELIGALGERAKREVGLIVEAQEGADSLVGELLGVVRRGAILPEQLSQLPPAEGASALAVAEVLAVPDSQVALLIGAGVGGGEVEGTGSVVEDMVRFYEDRGAQLHRTQRVIIDIHREGTAADVARLLKDGNVEGNAGLLSIPAEVIGGRGPGSTGACAKDIWVSVELLPGHGDTWCIDV